MGGTIQNLLLLRIESRLLTSNDTLLTMVSRQMIILAMPLPLSIDVFAIYGQLGANAVIGDKEDNRL